METEKPSFIMDELQSHLPLAYHFMELFLHLLGHEIPKIYYSGSAIQVIPVAI